MRQKAVLLQVSDFGLGRGLFLSEALAGLGFEVVAMTNQPVYQRPGARHETSGVTTEEVSVPFGRALYPSVPGRLIFYVLFTALSFVRMLRTRASLLYSRGPQPFTEISCLAYRTFFPSALVISDTTDLWPDSLSYVKMNPTIRSIMSSVGLAVNRSIFARVDALITHNDVMARILARRYGRPVSVIHGAVDLRLFDPSGPNEAVRTRLVQDGDRGQLWVVYAGLLGSFQNPLALVEVAARLRNEIKLVVAGRGPLEDDVRRAAESRGLSNIVFLGTQPFERMPELYRAADVCLLTYEDIPFLRIGLPKKFVEYSASGRLTFFLSPPCAASEICESWNAGYRVGPADFDGAAMKLRELSKDRSLVRELGMNARRMAEQLFSVESGTSVLRGVIASIRSQDAVSK